MCFCPTCKQPMPFSDELMMDATNGIVQRSGRRIFLRRGLSVRVLAALSGAYPGVMRRHRLIDAIYGDDPYGGPDTAGQVLAVVISNMRPPLRAIGVHICNAWGEGYRLELEPLEDMEKAA